MIVLRSDFASLTLDLKAEFNGCNSMSGQILTRKISPQLWENCRVTHIQAHELRLSMEVHKRVSNNTPPYSEAYLFHFMLKFM